MTLEENVVQAKQELSEYLGLQHQLALENTRLQERVHLSHDLHDGLGGSMLRSMMLLEQHQQVEKPQVMSILKLLRNDLRPRKDIYNQKRYSPENIKVLRVLKPTSVVKLKCGVISKRAPTKGFHLYAKC